MRLILALILSCTLVQLTIAEDSEDVSPLPPIKIDKHLRRALLKALEDLEAESEEQKSSNPPTAEGLVMKVTDSIDSERFSGASFSFSGFPSEPEEVPSEEKLQNSSFIETEKLQTPADPKETEKAAFQKYDVLLGDKEIQEKSPNPTQVDQILTRSVEITGGRSANSIDHSPKEKDRKESLSLSSSNGIASASANSLVPPSPTPPSPTVKPQNLTSPLLPTLPTGTTNKPNDSEVKIFQAPLVAAFTVQQDERGVPKSVVPLYRPGSDNVGLSLQEQLAFKEELLARQLAELQSQYARQAQFLYTQKLMYNDQLKLKQIQQNAQQQRVREQVQQQAQQQQQLQSQQQQLHAQQQQLHVQQQQLQNSQGAFSQNTFRTFQPPLTTQNVQFQPSVALQLPVTGVPPPFAQVPSVQDQLRLQQLQRQQNIQQAQQLQLQRQQALFLQQRLQQSFPGFQNEFQPPAPIPAQRFHRQEAFGSVGNFGVNDNRQIINRNNLQFEPPRLPPQDFGGFNQFGFRQQALRPQTPARQIQHLLFQSGVAGALQSPQNQQGTTNQEDLNIVSKVLALNVGAIPTKNLNYNDEGFNRA